jgi:uncharacterized protein Yka (UPF0111/DUF47 family)
LLVVSVVALAGTVILHAEESASRLSAAALREIAQLEDEIDRIEAQALERLAARLAIKCRIPEELDRCRRPFEPA